MRNLFFKIFGEYPANDWNGVEMFSWSHIVYLVLIVGTIVALTILFRKKELTTRTKVLDIIAIAIAVCYFADFFLQPIYRGDVNGANGEINLDKFPFHICIVLCPLILFSRFNKRCHGMKTPMALLASVAPLMWLIYPVTAIDTEEFAFSYEVIQLFVYHGLVFIYGCLYVLLHEEKLSIKKCYKEAIATVGIALWAGLGNAIYTGEEDSYDWFFLKTNPVLGDLIPSYINPFVIVIVVFLSCLVIYGIYYLVLYIYNKKQAKLTK